MSTTATSGMNALVPVGITAANYIASAVAEPDTTRTMGDGTVGEVEWLTGTNYPLNKRVILAATHRVYRDTAGGVSTVSPHLDPVRWFDEGPTNKWAWTDAQVATATVAPSPASFTVRPGVVTDIELFGLGNVDEVRVEMWSSPGGAKVFDELYSTEELAGSDPHWALYFLPPAQGETLSVPGLPVWPDCEVTVTVGSFSAQPVSVGLLALGSYEYLGLAQFGFEVVYRDYGYSITDKWGNTARKKGAKGKDLRGSALLEVGEVNGVDRVMRRLLDVGAIYVPSLEQNYRYMKTWGLLKPSSIQAAGPGHAIVSYDIEGNI